MKILKNRMFIGAICIIMAILCIFLGMKSTEKQNETIEVVVVKSEIKKGLTITQEMLATKTVGAKNLDDYETDTSAVIGKFALADFFKNDLVLKSKVADTLPTVQGKLLKLDGSRVAISVTLKDFASGVSDKVVSGDIVSCIVTTEEKTEVPMELNYVEVLATTTPSGTDKEYSDEVEEENLATATLLVTPYQATLLARYDKTAELHLALVYRGDKAAAQQFLDMQSNQIETALVKPESAVEEVPKNE